VRLRREGFSVAESQSAIWREPSWWLWWYPRSLRRAGNVWDRLPLAVRRLRWWLPAFAGYMALFLASATSLSSVVYRSRIPNDVVLRLFGVTLTGIAAMALLWAFLRARAKRELKRAGQGEQDIFRVLVSIPPSRVSFWSRPHIVALLAPAARRDPAGRNDSPHEQLQSILRHADGLSGALRPLGAEAAVAARQLLVSIENVDREIAELARNLEPGEEQRLADKIEALAAIPGVRDDSAPMRALLEKQLELIQGLSGRIEEAKESRNRRLEMLKMLALHVAALSVRASEPRTEVRSLSDRVRALCDDIARQTLALSEARAAAGIDQMATIDRYTPP